MQVHILYECYPDRSMGEPEILNIYKDKTQAGNERDRLANLPYDEEVSHLVESWDLI